MYVGRQRAEWDRTCQLLAIQLNMNRKKGARAVDPSALNPFAEKRRAAEHRGKKLEGKAMLEALRMLCPNATINRR